MRVINKYDQEGHLLQKSQFDVIKIETDVNFTSHIGKVKDDKANFPHSTLSQYRSRGYGVGSLISKPFQNEFYKQPGHPLYEPDKNNNEDNARFDSLKKWEQWTPNSENKK